MIGKLLLRFDNEEREWLLRWRLWKSRWLPYRTATLLDVKDDEMVLGPWHWNRPDALRRKRR